MSLLRCSIVTLALLVGACSSAPTSSNDVFLKRNPASSSANDSKDSRDSSSSNQNTPSGNDTTPQNDPPPSSTDAGGTTPPSTPTPPAETPGSCNSPKCTGLGGLCGCRGQDQGQSSTFMGCSDGECACAGKTFSDDGACDAVADKAALAALFVANCGCQ